MAGFMGPKNQGMEMGVASLAISLSDPLAKVLPSIPTTLCSAGLEVLVPKGGMVSPRKTTIMPFNWKLRLPPGSFGCLVSLNQQAKKGLMVLTGVIDPHYQGDIGLPCHSAGKEAYVWNIGDPSGHLLVFPCPLTKVPGKL